VPPYDYPGPPVHGFETDAPLRRVAALSVHTSPLATLGRTDAGGMNVYVRELSCHTAALGLPVDVFTRRTDPNTPETVALCPGVNVVSVTAGPPTALSKHEIFPLLPAFAAEVARYAARQGANYDAVHAHYWLSGWVAHLLKADWDTPFVQMFHTTAHRKNAVAGADGQESALRLDTERRLTDLADSLIAANPDERDDLLGLQQTPTDKVCAIPPGVDLDLFRPQNRTAARAALGLDIQDRVILFVGRIDPIKGIDTLLRAMGHLVAQAHSIPTLLFVGGETDPGGAPIGSLADLCASAAELGLAQSIRFVGSQPQDQLPRYYAAADVVAVPSRYESFGLVAVEAMACGTPVVASRAGGLAYTIEDEVSGLLVPVGDSHALAHALARVLDDRDLRTHLGAGARTAAQRYAWPAVATAIRHVYQRLANGHVARLCDDDKIYA